MKVRIVSKEDSQEFLEMATRYGTLFDSARWQAMFGDRLAQYAILDSGNRLRGGFFLYRERKCGVTVLRNPPFTPYNGPFLCIEDGASLSCLEQRREAIAAMADFVDAQNNAVVLLSLDPRVSDTLPFYWRNFKVIPLYTYVLSLDRPADEILRQMSEARRRNISKASRDGLRVECTEDYSIVRDLVLESFRRQQKAVEQQALVQILRHFCTSENSFAFVTFRDLIPLACVLVVHDGRTGYYLLGGYRSEGHHHGAGALAMFEAIKHAKRIGLRTFDFEGSVVPPIERYVRGFGGRLVSFYTISKAWLPLEILLKFRRRAWF